MQVQPYLNFDGRTEEALEFYRGAVGAEVEMLMRMGDGPEEYPVAPENKDKVMHASFKIGDSTLMASDCECQGKSTFAGISLSVTFGNGEEATKAFNALAEGGKVQQPVVETFFASHFGVVEDRFGVSWMIYVPTPM